ncbi:hypothetical protein OYC64_011213 [Pagothenia borchgrevinki]|uniref:MFS transporter n=1 Tax=Pagothenia borchgrevinki TaxID=8213 RepID=A0ABD2H0B1_PAGBO
MEKENPLRMMLMVCTISFGLEMCIAVGNVYVPPLLMQRGMEKQHMTMVFAGALILALIFLPVIGAESD